MNHEKKLHFISAYLLVFEKGSFLEKNIKTYEYQEEVFQGKVGYECQILVKFILFPRNTK